MHDRDDLRRALLTILDVDEPIVVRMRHEPDAAAARLLVAFGAGWVIDECAPACVRACGRRECAVSPRLRGEHQRNAVATPTPSATGFPPWEPNLIDWRHSLVLATKRADTGDETLEICAHCGCEVDVTPAPHKPGCAGIGAKRANSATSTSIVTAANEARRQAARAQARADVEGLELLEAMDAGERLPVAPVEEEAAALDPGGAFSSTGDDDEEPELEEAPVDRLGPDGGASSSSDDDETVLGEEAAVGDSAVSGAALFVSEPERAATSPNPANPYGLAKKARGYAWTREAIVAAMRAWAADHDGNAPTIRTWSQSDGAIYPAASTVVRRFGTWAAAFAAAGFQERRRGAQLPGSGSTIDSPRPAELEINSKSRPGWIKVDGTGLAYRTPADAYTAAAEIEADGERVATAAREDGNHGKADQAQDAARELADKIRVAARAAEDRAAPPEREQQPTGARRGSPGGSASPASGPVALPRSEGAATSLLDESTSAIVAELLRRVASAIDAGLFRGADLVELFDGLAGDVTKRLEKAA